MNATRIAAAALMLSVAVFTASCGKNSDSDSKEVSRVEIQPAAPRGLDMCEWMIGTWTGPLGEMRAEEEWRAEGGVLVGEGRTYREDKLVFTETLRIEGGVSGPPVYVARPQGSVAPTSFALTDSTATLVRFENREHDFPQTIRYEFVDGTKMRIRLDGTEDGKFREMDYTLTRKP